MKKVLVASNNLGKIREISGILAELGIEVVPQKALGIVDVEETGLSFIENALIKARHASAVSGLAAIADDSGLEVDALLGRPGIHSARFAGPDASDAENNVKLVKCLQETGLSTFTARFRCVMVYMRHHEDPSPVIGQGVWSGEIILEPRGQDGFGYDPYFWLPDLGVTAAEISHEEKNRRSHRGVALRSLLSGLRLING